MKYLYIHGANATGQSFNYIRSYIKGNDILLEYNAAMGFEHNFVVMKEKLAEEKDLFVIGHSMGGIYGLHLANHFPEKFLGAVTLSTPYSGSSVAEIAKWVLPYYRLIHDIVPDSRLIKTTRELQVKHPWCQVVTTGGHVPWLLHPNDGVVSVASMKSRDDVEMIEAHLNHYEVMVSPTVVKIIKDKIKAVNGLASKFKIFR